MKNTTTVGELKQMLEEYSDNTKIVLKVRGNSTTDYSTDMGVVVTEHDYNDNFVIIMDKLSWY